MRFSGMRRAASAAALVLCAATVAAPTGARALDCDAVKEAGTAAAPAILARLNEGITDASHEITPKKHLTVNSAQSVYLTGCDVTVLANVTLTRDLNNTIRGLVTFSTPVTRMDDAQICVGPVRFEKSTIRKDVEVGFNAYQWAKDQVIRDDSCFDRPQS